VCWPGSIVSDAADVPTIFSGVARILMILRVDLDDKTTMPRASADRGLFPCIEGENKPRRQGTLASFTR
jgi:hypothetical protein